MKAKYIVLCLNTSTEFQNARGVSRHSALMGVCWTCSYMSQPNQMESKVVVWYPLSTIFLTLRACSLKQSIKKGVISVLGKLNLFRSDRGESSPSLLGFASVKNFYILNAAFQKAPQLKDSRLSKCQRRLLQEMWYLC